MRQGEEHRLRAMELSSSVARLHATLDLRELALASTRADGLARADHLRRSLQVWRGSLQVVVERGAWPCLFVDSGAISHVASCLLVLHTVTRQALRVQYGGVATLVQHEQLAIALRAARHSAAEQRMAAREAQAARDAAQDQLAGLQLRHKGLQVALVLRALPHLHRLPLFYLSISLSSRSQFNVSICRSHTHRSCWIPGLGAAVLCSTRPPGTSALRRHAWPSCRQRGSLAGHWSARSTCKA